MAAETNFPPHDVMRATRQGKTVSALLAILVSSSSLAVLFFSLPRLTMLLDISHASSAPILFKAALVAVASLAVLCGTIMIFAGRKILRCGQYPASDAWLIRDTKIRRGREAVRLAWSCIISGVLACVWSVGFAVYIWVTPERAAPLKLPPGVTIIQKKTFAGNK
jgi:hypothetical protein